MARWSNFLPFVDQYLASTGIESTADVVGINLVAPKNANADKNALTVSYGLEVDDGSTITKQGSVLTLTNTKTETSGTITESSNILVLQQQAASTSPALWVAQAAEGPAVFIDSTATLANNMVLDIDSVLEIGYVIDVDLTPASPGTAIGMRMVTGANSTGNCIYVDNDGSGTVLNIDSEATGADAINVDAVNTSGTVVDINLTPGVASTAISLSVTDNAYCTGPLAYFQSYSTSSGIEVNMDGTGNAIYVHADGVLATAHHALNLYSNAVQVNSPLVMVRQDNDSSTADCVEIDNDGTGTALYVHADADCAASHPSVYIYTTEPQTNSPLMQVQGNDPGITETILNVVQTSASATGATLACDQNGNGIALNIDTEATSADAINVDAVNTSGSVVDINLAPGSASSAVALDVEAGANCTNRCAYITSLGSATTLDVLHATTAGKAVFINQDTNSISIDIDTEATSADAINVDAVNTSGTVVDINHTTSAAASTACGIDLYMNPDTSGATTGMLMTMGANTTGYGLKIDHQGVLAASNNALWVYSNAAQVNSPLVMVQQDNDNSTAGCVEIDNDGTGNGIYVHQDGVLNGKRGLYVYSDAAQTISYLSEFKNDNASTTVGTLLVTQDGTGQSIKCDQNGNGTALDIDSEATGADAINVDAVNTSGTLVDINEAPAKNASINVNCLDIDYSMLVDDASTITKQGAVIKIAGTNTETSGTITDTSVGIDLSSWPAEVFKFAADATDPTGGGGAAAGRIAIDIGGSTQYLAYY